MQTLGLTNRLYHTHANDAKKNNLNSVKELKQKIVEWYDGYRFDLSEAGNSYETLFNPFSIHALVRNGYFGAYWAITGNSSWILTQEICKYLLRSKFGSSFRLSLDELSSMRIDYKELGAHSGSLPMLGTESPDIHRLRLLVSLHAGYLSIESVENASLSANVIIPNEEVIRDALSYINKSSGATRWRSDLDEGVVQDDVRIMMKALCGEDGFLNYWREGVIIDSFSRKESVRDISEAWLERMMSFMFHIGNIKTTLTQFKVPKHTSSTGVSRVDIIFNGNKYVHVLELKHKRTSLDDAKEQLEGYSGRERLKAILKDWNKTALYWVVYFDESHLGKAEDIVAVSQIKVWAEGPYEKDKNGKLQLR